jgi:hypothetical protein
MSIIGFSPPSLSIPPSSISMSVFMRRSPQRYARVLEYTPKQYRPIKIQVDLLNLGNTLILHSNMLGWGQALIRKSDIMHPPSSVAIRKNTKAYAKAVLAQQKHI